MNRLQWVFLFLLGLDVVASILLASPVGRATGWSLDTLVGVQWLLYHAFGALYLAFMCVADGAISPPSRT